MARLTRPHTWLNTYDRTPIFLLATGIAWWLSAAGLGPYMVEIGYSDNPTLALAIFAATTIAHTWVGWKFYARYIDASPEKRAQYPRKELPTAALAPISLTYWISSYALLIAFVPFIVFAAFIWQQEENAVPAIAFLGLCAASSPINRWRGKKQSEPLRVVIVEDRSR